MTTVLVSGAIANKCFSGGSIWTRLSYLLGLKKLGHQVCFVEKIHEESCVDATGASVRFEQSVNRTRFQEVSEAYGLLGSAALICEPGGPVFGMTPEELDRRIDQAVVLIDISGHLGLHGRANAIPCKVFVDQDPGFTQFWHASGYEGGRLEGYDHYFTVGQNIGSDVCPIPPGGIRWRPTRQPLLLEYWPSSSVKRLDRFTTVASWRGTYGRVEFQGRTHGLKVHEFRKVLELPRRCPQRFEIALDIHAGDEPDRQALANNGWQLVDPKELTGSPECFRRYVQNSGAEFSVAQGVYVETNSGWFSDRTTRYLASGKPALVQETGFSENLPVGEGLLSFRTLEEAVSGAQAIAGDYEKHSRAARLIAEEFFDSDKVLGKMLEEIGVAP